MKRIILLLALFLTSCATKPPAPQGFAMPSALREVFRGGQLIPLQNATSPDLGIGEPSNYDRVQHVCVSKPLYSLNGSYHSTQVLCW